MSPRTPSASLRNASWHYKNNPVVTASTRLCDTCPATQDACYRQPQSCLANQIKDLYTTDMAAAKAGKTPQYLVTRYGAGNNGGKQARWPLRFQSHALAHMLAAC